MVHLESQLQCLMRPFREIALRVLLTTPEPQPAVAAAEDVEARTDDDDDLSSCSSSSSSLGSGEERTSCRSDRLKNLDRNGDVHDKDEDKDVVKGEEGGDVATHPTTTPMLVDVELDLISYVRGNLFADAVESTRTLTTLHLPAVSVSPLRRLHNSPSWQRKQAASARVADGGADDDNNGNDIQVNVFEWQLLLVLR